MSGALTEARFLQLLTQLLKSELDPIKKDISQLKTDVTQLKTDLSQLKKQVGHLQGFQDMESKAIEYELRQLIQKYLKRQYPLLTVSEFEMKEMKHPETGVLLTDLDGAYTLAPIVHKIDLQRIANAGMDKMNIPKFTKTPTMFILMEAKHVINRTKVAKKLAQMDAIILFFECARGEHPELKLYSKFAKTVEHNKYILGIKEYILFFGASMWEGSLMDDLERDVAERKELVNNFFDTPRRDRKIGIYNKIREMERKWYMDKLPPDNDLSDDEIVALKDIRGAMGYVQFILPSGERYSIHGDAANVQPIGTLPVGGKRSTRKRSAKE